MEKGIMPVRIQRKRVPGWKMPANTVYVGRPTKWGNPFKVCYIANKQDCVDNFRLVTCAEKEFRKMIRKELKGKNLACWCKPGEPCHADILLKIANS